MPTYFFHVCDSETIRDVDGTDLADRAAARVHAVGVVQELMFHSEGMLGRDWSSWSMSVHDAAGVELFSFPFTDVEERND